MFYALYPTFDTTLYEKYERRNTGTDEILELWKLTAGTRDPEGGTWEATYNSRILLQFDISNLNSLLNSGTVSKSSTYYLSLRATQATDLPVNHSVEISAVSQSWSNGNGSYGDYPNITQGASWRYRDGYFNDIGQRWITGSGFTSGTTGSYVSKSGGGTWYTGSGYSVTHTIYYSDPDFRVDVTDIVHKWLSGSIDNNGFIIKRTDVDEASSTHLGSVKYFGKDTHTIFMPKLEAVWDSSTLSGTGSFVEVNNLDEPVIFVKNIKQSYKQTEKARLRLTTRNKYPTRTYSTSSNFLTVNRLPTSSFYSVKDTVTELDIIPFDTSSTKISVDSRGNFFDLNMNAFLPERYYRILFKVQQEGGMVERIIDNDTYFKVVR